MSSSLDHSALKKQFLHLNADHDRFAQLFLSPDAVADARRVAAHRQVRGDWLSRFHWLVYATASFRVRVNLELAELVARQWVVGMGPDAYGYLAYEVGPVAGRTHVHALLGGLPGMRRDSSARCAAAHWRHGDILSEAYDARRGAAHYVVKFPEQGELVGCPSRHRRRHR